MSEPPLATLLRGLRLDAGLSMPAMAARLGISERTLSHYELGSREPPHRILERYLEVTPGLQAAELLLADDRAWPRAWCDAWPRLRDALGYVVDDVSVESRPSHAGGRHETTSLRGLRPLSASMAVADVMTALARAACEASPPRLRTLVAPRPGETVRLVEGRRRHALWLSRAGTEIDCVTETDGLPLDGDALPPYLHHDVLHPIERLRLRLDLGRSPPPGARPSLVAWPTVVGADPTWNVASVLLADAELSVHGAVIEALIRRPLPGLRCAIGWVAQDQPRPLPPPEGEDLAARLRSLRSARELSLRDAAERLENVSHVSVRNAELGHDVSHGMLRAYLRAFPDVAPHDLLGRPRGEAPGLDAVWHHVRDAFGLCAREIVKRARVQDDGRAAVTVRTSHLRRLRPGGSGLELRHGGILGVFQASPHAIDAIVGAPDAKIVRGQVEYDGVAHHVFRFQRHEVSDGLSFTVRNVLSEVPQFTLFERAVERDLGPGAHHEGTSHWVRFPCERLRVAVSLPKGVRPPRIVGHVCPWRIPPEVGLPRLSEIPATPVPLVRERHGRLTITITIDRPLVGFKYGLAWQLA